MLAFRIFVMLSCLIIVPMAAIFGSAFPDVVKAVLVDRIMQWATGKLPESAPTANTEGFSTVAPGPAPAVDLGGAPTNAADAPRWGSHGGPAETSAPPFAGNAGQVVPAAATSAAVQNDHQQASYIAPAGQSPLQTGHGRPGGAPGDAAGASAPSWSASEAQADPFTAMERKLREYGATYYLLETWGNQREMFRFHCKMAVGNDPNYTRHFEAIDSDALRAMNQVVNRVEAWRAGRVQ